MKKIISIALLVLLWSCEKPPSEEYKPELNIFCLLRTNAKEQRVEVSRSYKMDEPSDYDLEDVIVILSGDNFTDTLIPETDTPGLYKDSVEIKPLHTYHLLVSAKDMDTVRGRTSVPGDFEIIYPEEGDTLSSAGDSLVLKKSKGARGYYIILSIVVDTTYSGSYSWTESQDTTQDSLVSYHIPTCFHIWESGSGSGIIKIIAMDTNYWSYRHKWDWEEEGIRLQEGIEGGLGVFGSAVVDSVRIFIKRE